MSTKTVAERVAHANSYVGKGSSLSGWCEQFTRLCFGFKKAIYYSALLAYNASADKGPVHIDYNAPAGVPVFWDILSGKNKGYDHVAISVGGGYCISTSAGPGGSVGKVKISDLTKRWGMRYRGWAEFYHGVRVWSPPKPVEPGKGLTIPGVTRSTYPYIASNPRSDASLDASWATLLYAAGYRSRFLKTRFRQWLRDAGVYDGPINTSKKHDRAQIEALQTLLKGRTRLSYQGNIDGKRGPMMRAAEHAHLEAQRKNVLRIINTGK